MRKGKWPKRTTWKCQRNADTREIGWNLQRGTCIDLAQWWSNLLNLANRPDSDLPAQARAEGIVKARNERIGDIIGAIRHHVPEPGPVVIAEPIKAAPREPVETPKPKRTRKPKFRTLRPNVRKFRFSRTAARVVELTA